MENNGLARPATLAKPKTHQKAMNQTITITANIAHGIEWGLELAQDLDQGLEVWNQPRARCLEPARGQELTREALKIWEVDVER